MKRFLGACAVLVAATLAFSAAPADAQSNTVPGTPIRLNWRTSAANTAGYIDSSTASINGAIGTTGTIDTTVAFSTAGFAWVNGLQGATAHGAFRIAFTSSANTSTDTLFVAVESSPDGTVWCTNSTFVGLVGVSGEEYLSGVVTADNDLQGTAGAGTIWMQPYLRLRVRADGNTGALFPTAKVWILPLKGKP